MGFDPAGLRVLRTRVNYLAPVQLTLALLPQMLERGSGRIVNVSSVAATLSSPGEAVLRSTAPDAPRWSGDGVRG